MGDEIELLKRRLKREKSIRQQAEKIAEEKSRELYLKGLELKQSLEAEAQARQEIEVLYRQVERLSRIDPLTELSNRRSFNFDAIRFFQLAIRHKGKLSCAMLDIDYFKQVNDRHGHDFGDKVLIAVAQTCQKIMRKTDLLARYGGEEFCFLFPDTDLNGAALIAERIRYDISQLSFEGANKRSAVTASIGVSALLGPNDTLESMLKRSDDSLYRAKENGRNRVEIWDG